MLNFFKTKDSNTQKNKGVGGGGEHFKTVRTSEGPRKSEGGGGVTLTHRATSLC